MLLGCPHAGAVKSQTLTLGAFRLPTKHKVRGVLQTGNTIPDDVTRTLAEPRRSTLKAILIRV